MEVGTSVVVAGAEIKHEHAELSRDAGYFVNCIGTPARFFIITLVEVLVVVAIVTSTVGSGNVTTSLSVDEAVTVLSIVRTRYNDERKRHTSKF